MGKVNAGDVIKEVRRRIDKKEGAEILKAVAQFGTDFKASVGDGDGITKAERKRLVHDIGEIAKKVGLALLD